MHDKTVALDVGGGVNVPAEIEAPKFSTAVEEGEKTHEEGYHQPGQRVHGRRCGCSLTTSKGAYRDVTAEMPDGRTVHFYHQSPIVVKSPSGMYRASHYGYDTSSTTKERLNLYLPSGYHVYQEDYQWYLTTPEGEVEWNDPMYLHPL